MIHIVFCHDVDRFVHAYIGMYHVQCVLYIKQSRWTSHYICLHMHMCKSIVVLVVCARLGRFDVIVLCCVIVFVCRANRCEKLCLRCVHLMHRSINMVESNVRHAKIVFRICIHDIHIVTLNHKQLSW